MQIKSVVQSSLLAMALAFASVCAQAAPAAFPTVTTPVTLDGVPLVTADYYQAFNTVVFDGGKYHMWYVRGEHDPSLYGVYYATSTDGINFSAQNKINFPANWWAAYGAQEPFPNYVRVSRDGGGNWILMIWHPNDASVGGQLSYNTSLWMLGNNVANASPTLIGPLPAPLPGQHVGASGIVGSDIYVVQDSAKGVGRYALTLSTPPTVSPNTTAMAEYADAYAGTGFCMWQLSGCAAADKSYLHNYARTLDQGGGVIGTYYALRSYPAGTRRGKQLWYLESSNSGSTWSASAQPLFANGNAVTVDGLPNTENFGLPEVAALGGGQFRSYFSTADACGNLVMVTAAAANATRGPTVSKSFNPTVVPLGGNSQVTVTLTAPAATCTPAPSTPVYTGLGFTDALPSGMTVAATPNASTTCGGATLTANAGTGSFSLSGATLAPAASCTATVSVTVANAGTFVNTIHATFGQPGGITNDQGVSALSDAVASLQVAVPAQAVPAPTLGQWALTVLGLMLTALVWRRKRGHNALQG